MVEVTQACRDAAASTLAWALAPTPEDISHWKTQCIAGEYDNHHIVQAFAAAIAEGRRQMREEAALMADYQSTISGCQKRRTKSLGLYRETYFTEIGREAAAAIRAIPIGDE